MIKVGGLPGCIGEDGAARLIASFEIVPVNPGRFGMPLFHEVMFDAIGVDVLDEAGK